MPKQTAGKNSLLSLFLCYLLILFTGIFYYPKWEKSGTEATLSWDVSGYYLYLSSLFIYKDLDSLKFYPRILDDYGPTPDFQQAFPQNGNGKYVLKYASGQALMLSPFFFAAQAWVSSNEFSPADGYAYPYQLAIGIGALFYSLLGLFLLRKLLLRYFSDSATALTLFSIAAASNYLNYAAIDGAMTHNTLFTVYAGLLLLTSSFYRKPSLIKGVGIGALIGIAALTRPTEIISSLIPLFWGLASIKELNQRLKFYQQNFRFALSIILPAAAIVSLQIIYWKWVSGNFFVYSYNDEGFDWLRPHVADALISIRSGWLTYSPIMVLSIIGFRTLYKNHRTLFISIFPFVILFTYLCFAWQTWWYGGSLGIRAMIQSYPALAFPMAAVIQSGLSKKGRTKLFLFVFIGAASLYNFYWTHQSHLGGLMRAGEMTPPYFWKVVGRFKVEDRVQFLLDTDYMLSGEVNESLIYEQDFTRDSAAGKIILDEKIPYSKEYSFPIPSKTDKVRARALIHTPLKVWDKWKMPQFIIKYFKGSDLVDTKFVRIARIMNDGETKEIIFDSKVPEGADRGIVIFYNGGGANSVEVYNLKVASF